MTSAQERIRNEMRMAKGLGGMMLAQDAPRAPVAKVEDGPTPLLSVAPACGTMPGLIVARSAVYYFCG